MGLRMPEKKNQSYVRDMRPCNVHVLVPYTPKKSLTYVGEYLTVRACLVHVCIYSTSPSRIPGLGEIYFNRDPVVIRLHPLLLNRLDSPNKCIYTSSAS